VTVPTAVHPRPQLTRPRWTELGGTWSFAPDDADEGLSQRWFDGDDAFPGSIEVPFPPESPASGVADPSYHPVVWYRRAVRATAAPGERLLLHFGAVDHRASVWVNGRLVATHEGGHTPFSADITPVLDPDGEQVVTVRAEDDPRDLTQPRGKQDWQERPHSVFYERTTGIWQPVWLEPVPDRYVETVRWLPDLPHARLTARVTLRGRVEGLRLRTTLRLHGELLAEHTVAVTGRRVVTDVALDAGRIAHDRRAYLWAPDHPNLVEATLTLLDGDREVDEVGSYVGLRQVDVANGRLRLNGRATVLRMVLAQNYWPQSHLAAPDGDALRREVELIKSLGFNGVRIHQKVEDPRFLHWCSVLGLLAWGEMPSAFVYDTDTLARLAREWLEVLERDASVPAIVAWVPFNESWGVPDLESDAAQQHAVRALYSLTKAFDPSRVVVANDGWEHVVSDVFGVHDYVQEAGVLRERYGSREAARRTMRETEPYYRSIVLGDVDPLAAPLVISECGGATYDPESDAFWNGYGAVDSPGELQERYTAIVTALLASPAVAGFCWTQLTDTAQERNGLLYADRRPKVDVDVIAAANRQPSGAAPADAIAEIQITHASRRDEPTDT
jgi:beta-galactosidase/beta-glucuronidase